MKNAHTWSRRYNFFKNARSRLSFSEDYNRVFNSCSVPRSQIKRTKEPSWRAFATATAHDHDYQDEQSGGESSSSSSSSSSNKKNSGTTFEDRFREAKKSAAKQRTYYDVLEIEDINCDEKHVKKQYLQMCLKYHPDTYKGDDAEVRFREVQEAYFVLKDKWKRKTYDTEIRHDAADNVFGYTDGKKSGTHAQNIYNEATWTAHWGSETPEQLLQRRERYRKYAAGGPRSDTGSGNAFSPNRAFIFVGASTVFCFMLGEYAPMLSKEWAANETDFSDADVYDSEKFESHLVLAYFNVVSNRWERAPHGEVPSPEELYAAYSLTDLHAAWPLDKLVVTKLERRKVRPSQVRKFTWMDGEEKRVEWRLKKGVL